MHNHILTVGPDYNNPKGGIAKVLNSYSKIYSPFNFLVSTKGKNKIINLFVLITSLIKYLYWINFKSIEIIHIHGASYMSFYRKKIYIDIGKFFKKKVIYHIHGGEFQKFAKLEGAKKISKTLNKCDTIIALSKTWKKYFENEFLCENVQIIPNIIEAPIVSKEKKNNENLIKFLFLGKICDSKGIFDLLEVINKNKEQWYGKFRLYVGGDGEINKLLNYISNNGLINLIHFKGWVDGDKKNYLLNTCDIYVLPSYHEGLPISILEAMSYGMPIISSNVGGIPEIIDQKNGIIIEPGNKEALEKAINFFLRNDIIKDYQDNSIKKAIPHLPENVLKELNKLYSCLY